MRCWSAWIRKQLEERLAQWPVSRAAEICGLEESVIANLGREIADTRPTALRVGLGLQRTGGRGAAIRAITALPALTRGKSGPIRVMLNPADAIARGIEDGAQVRVHNDRGEFHAAAVITDRARPDVAMAPKQ